MKTRFVQILSHNGDLYALDEIGTIYLLEDHKIWIEIINFRESDYNQRDTLQSSNKEQKV